MKMNLLLCLPGIQHFALIAVIMAEGKGSETGLQGQE